MTRFGSHFQVRHQLISPAGVFFRESRNSGSGDIEDAGVGVNFVTEGPQRVKLSFRFLVGVIDGIVELDVVDTFREAFPSTSPVNFSRWCFFRRSRNSGSGDID